MRPNTLARIEASSPCVVETHLDSTVPATSQELREVVARGQDGHDCGTTLNGISPRARHSTRCLGSQCLANRSHRFSCLVTESDEDLEGVPPTVLASDNAVRRLEGRVVTALVHMAGIDPEKLSDTATDPDCEPVVGQPFRRRILVLVPRQVVAHHSQFRICRSALRAVVGRACWTS